MEGPSPTKVGRVYPEDILVEVLQVRNRMSEADGLKSRRWRPGAPDLIISCGRMCDIRVWWTAVACVLIVVLMRGIYWRIW